MSKSTVVSAKIIEVGDNAVGKPEIYLLQETGNKIFVEVTREWLIDLVRGKGETFSPYEDVEVTISISKKIK